MKRTRILSWFVLLMLSIILAFPTQAFAESKVYHVPIENNVEKGLAAFLQRAFQDAESHGAEAIVLEIHTPGGFTDAAEDIAKIIKQSDIRVIAFINTKAHSAGALIALNADAIYMTSDATIGSAGVIDGTGNAAELKAQSAWITQMIAAAESTERNPEYARAMADPTVDMSEYRAPKGKYLTLSAAEALEVDYSNGTVSSLQEVLAKEGLADSTVINMEPTVAEQITRIVTNPIVIPILLSIASLGLVIELYSPGFGVSGIMGLSALGLFFFGHLIAGFAGYESILLLLIGIILIIAEFFVPGGIVGIIGGVLIVLSLLLAGADFVQMGYSILIAMLIAVIGMVILMKFFGKKLHMFNKLVLKDATTTEEGYVSNVNRLELIGKKGKTVTPFRPAGVVFIDGERVDAVSDGSYIDAGKQVEIIKVEGSRIVVRAIEEMEEL
ncbi:nodulation protein NfeD [Metasolibacillus meyeri]|uniref:Nodulation protein NfeD n=1 Tax=Metasolibacillus meyeri TaxID=1071052 RepID=A0AAW9NU06_9BACL|nr:nodulation protein NfeD [Metasolibacillus meyeri]MEC1179916.1 nodulation protein NfeD [Metasolibacillus meyeri]